MKLKHGLAGIRAHIATAMSLALIATLLVAPAANAAQYSDHIDSTTTLYAGDSLRSPNGQFHLAMQSDGNLVLYAFGNTSMWATLTFQPGSRVVLQGDGNLVVYNSSDQSLWQSQTSGSGAARLTLQNDGNIVLRTLGGTLLWASYSSLSQILVGQELRTDYSLRSPNGNYKLVMQSDGNLVIYNTTTNPWQAIWWRHAYAANSYAVLQSDGNFVLYKGTGGSSYQSQTSGAMSRLALENDGRIAIYRSNGSLAWDNVSLAIPPVPAQVQAAAQEIMAYGSAVQQLLQEGPADVDWITQIQSLANGGPANGNCYVDLRVLQTILLVLDRFGSVKISGLNRKCAGQAYYSDICGGSDAPTHCGSTTKAVDFSAIGGVTVNGQNSRSLEALTYLHGILPQGTRVGQGQTSCRNPSQSWPRYIQFADACTHIHMDFSQTSGTI